MLCYHFIKYLETVMVKLEGMLLVFEITLQLNDFQVVHGVCQGAALLQCVLTWVPTSATWSAVAVVDCMQWHHKVKDTGPLALCAFTYLRINLICLEYGP
jgi:hypothetical protein